MMTGISGLVGAGMGAAASEVAQGNMSQGVVRANMMNMNKYDAALSSSSGVKSSLGYDDGWSSITMDKQGQGKERYNYYK